MPTYSYACADCGHRFDIYQAFTDDALTECPQCGGTLRKQFGSVGVVFKGSGFYRTDARGKTGSESGSATPSNDSSSTGSSSGGDSTSSKTGGSTSSSGSSSTSSTGTSTPAATTAG